MHTQGEISGDIWTQEWGAQGRDVNADGNVEIISTKKLISSRADKITWDKG